MSRLPQEKEVWYLEIEPVDYKPVDVRGKNFSFTAKWTEFRACSPRSTMNYPGDGQPNYSCIEQTSKGTARKLYQVCKANPDVLRNVSWSDFSGWLQKMKIGFEWHHSQWT